MKNEKIILSIAITLMMIVNGYSQDSKSSTSKEVLQTTSFGVRGNCGMCKATIEKAANSVEGVSSAVWDKENKKIDISYDASKTNLMDVHNAVAVSGYDTNLSTADENAYNNLAGCCQYDREMKMNSSAKKKDDHSGHKH